MPEAKTLIVGASIAGLSAAACLRRLDLDFKIIEKNDRAGAPWYNHYERLHLHTCKMLSNLPYKKFPKSFPRYPSREEVVEYLEDYRRSFAIEPICNCRALNIHREEQFWITETTAGVFRSKYLIMATGALGLPKPIVLKGMDTFPGKIIHSSGYRSGRVFKGQRVLVIGFGNSACEIAIDLCEQGAKPSMSLRSAVNVIPRDILGLPVQQISLWLSWLPPRIADILSAPLIKILIGDLRKLGLKKLPYGPIEEISRYGNAPVLDIGTLDHIRKGDISLYTEIDRLQGSKVIFRNGIEAEFDAIVAAIGYYSDVASYLHTDDSRFDDLRLPVGRQKYFADNGLYFCGYWISPTGQMREIASDATLIAHHIARLERKATRA